MISLNRHAGIYDMAEESYGPYTIVQSYIWLSAVPPRPVREKAHFVWVYDASKTSDHSLWRSANYIQAEEARLLWLRMTSNIPATIMAIELGLPIDSGINEGTSE